MNATTRVAALASASACVAVVAGCGHSSTFTGRADHLCAVYVSGFLPAGTLQTFQEVVLGAERDIARRQAMIVGLDRLQPPPGHEAAARSLLSSLRHIGALEKTVIGSYKKTRSPIVPKKLAKAVRASQARVRSAARELSLPSCVKAANG